MLKHYKILWWVIPAFSLITLLSFATLFKGNTQKNNDRLTLKDQVSLYHGMSPEEIEKMPKYDRPEMAVMQDFNMTKDPSLNNVPVERTVKTFEKIKAKKGLNKAALQGVNWEERGPNNIGGRTRAIMFDPNDANNRKVWAGSVGGGLWFNNDITSANSQWQNVNDFWANLALTTIAYDPTNTQTFYVGTGEGYFNADAIRGAGIWKSTNGGASWTQLPSTANNSDFFFVQKVAVTSSGTVLATTHTGLYRSTNGGSSWTQVLDGGRFADIEIASNGDIYASRGIFSPGTLFKSTNDGVSFSDVTPATGGERIEIAIAPSNPNVVYAVASNSTNVAWFRKSTNGGASWTNVTIPIYLEQSCSPGSQDFTRGQAWYNLIMSVQPNNPDIVLVGGIDVHRSTNGGSSWRSVSYWTGRCGPLVHADQHAMAFRPGSSNTAIFGHDGGLSYSTNVGNASASPTFAARNNGYNVTQYYAADHTSNNGSNFILAGAQDNGSHTINSNGIGSATEVTGGDGGFCHIDQDNSNFQITSFTFSSFSRSTNGGNSFSSILSNSTFGRFISPSEYDDSANILYSAANEDGYIRISGITGTPNPELVTAALGGFKVSALKVSPHTNNRLFIGTGTDGNAGGSRVYRVDNANAATPTVTQISTASIPVDGFISSVEIGSSDNQILVTLSNYGIVSVWETRNGGSSWANREGNLPDIPVRWGLYNPNNTNEVLLATELGVWSTDNINTGNPNWGVTNTGLANVRVDMLKYRPSDGQVLAATHGRGVYTATPFNGASAGDTTPPTTPTALSSSNVTTNSFDVNWNASSDNVGVANYTVSLNGAVSGTTANTSFSFTNLTASTNYSVSVVANDAAGNSSSAATINVTTGTPSPAGLTCSSTISSFPYDEGFEGGNSGDWVQATGDDGNWFNFTGSTPSSGTGPSSADEGSRYLYLEASTNGSAGQIGNNATAILESPCFDLSGVTDADFSFSYHMFGADAGTITVAATTDGTNFDQLFTITGEQGNAWFSQSVSLAAYLGNSVRLRITGTTGSSWRSDIAVDGLSLSATTGSGGGSNIACTTSVSSFPYSESFEGGAGTWVQAAGDDGDWVNDADGTPSGTTGPSSAINGNFYMFLEASTNNSPGQIGNNATAILESPCLDLSSQSAASFNFSYHMLGANMGTLRVEASTDGTTWTEIWSRSGDQGNSWFNESLSLSAYLGTTVKLRFNGTTGSSWRSDMAIDNVSVTNAPANIAPIASNASLSFDTEEISISVFPNPVVNSLRIQMKGYEVSQYSVIALSGKIIEIGSIDGEKTINMSNLPAGYYLVKIDHEEGTTVEKVLKN